MRSTVLQNIMSMTALLCSIGMSSRGIRPTSILVSAFSPTRISTSRNFITNKGNTFQQPKPHSPSNIIRLHSSMKEEVDPGKVDGTDLQVLKYPAPSLRAENEEITEEELKSGDIKQIAKEMFLVMYATEGVGLAAPQVGINKCLMVYNETGDKKKWMQEVIMVNPKIVEFSEAKDIESEGCLSFPGMNGDVERSKWIKVEAQNIRGKKFKKKFKGWEARIFQHEYDHLDGVLYPDRLTEEGTAEVKPRIDELIAEFGEDGAL